MKKRVFPAYCLILLLVIVAVGAAYWILPDYSEIINEQRSRNGTLILDRNSKIIRLLPDDQGSFRIWCEIEQAPNDLKKCILAAEDKRFFYHPGFDPIAILRALYSNLSAGRVKSGASTITQQVIRLIHPRPRTYKSKLIELLSACKMEIQLSKEQILELYINLCPMGGNIRGVAFAAKKYFGKSVDRINMAESAILAVLPRSPSKFDPMHAKGQKRLFLEKDRLLKRMAELGWIESDTLKIMTGPMASFKNRPVPLEAPHFVDFLMTKNVCQQSLIKTTIDLNLQHSMEEIFRSQIKRLHKLGIEQAGLIIASVKDSEVLAMIGSLEYATKYQGFNNATLALRGAGSVLKPFLYAVAIEQGKNSFTEIPDTYKTYATPQGDYQPYNADRRWYGPVSLRLALGNSLNVPAVKTLQEIGVGEFYKHLERLGLINEKSDPPEHYGLGLAIGNIEVNLFRLVQAYGALARLGIYKQLKVICGKTEEQHRVFSPETTYLISHILADPCARLLTFGNPYYYDFGFPVSVKTGTSSNYRDAWMIAYTSDHIIGLWAGNFNGRPTNGVSAANALGPIMELVVKNLYSNNPPNLIPRPESFYEQSICWFSGKLATDECPYTFRELTTTNDIPYCNLSHDKDYHYYLGAAYAHWLDRKETEQGRNRFRLKRPGTDQFDGDDSITRKARIEIVNPHNHDRFISTRNGPNRILFRAVPSPLVKYVVWIINGIEVAKSPPPYEFSWKMTRGRHVVHAVTPNNEAAQVIIHVE